MSRYLAVLIVIASILVIGATILTLLQISRPLDTATSPTPSIAVVDRVQLYFVALEDNGQLGRRFGCNDSLVALERQIPPTTAPLRAALTALLATQEDRVGEHNFYNALAQSELEIGSVRIENETAVIELTGEVQLGGVCDTPRVIEQLQATAMQFPTVSRTQIILNGQLIEEALSTR